MAVDFATTFQTFYPPGAARIYVALSGNDNNAGTAGSPKRTIGAAINAVGTGGIVYVGDGDFGSVTVSGKNLSANSWCLIMSQNWLGAKLTTTYGRAFDINNSSYVGLFGFEVIGLDDPSHTWSDCVGHTGNTHHVAIWRNHCHDGSHGVAGAGNLGPINNWDICYNIIHDCGKYLASAASGISLFEFWNSIGSANDVYGYSNYIVGNRCYHNYNIAASSDGNGIIIDDMNNTQSWGGPTGQPYTGRFLCLDNICVDNGGRGVHGFDTSHLDEYFNTVAHNMWAQPDTNQAELSTIGVASTVTDLNQKWNVAKVNTATGRTKWLDNYNASPTTDANVYLAGAAQGTNSRNRSGEGFNYFTNNNPSMAPLTDALLANWVPDGGSGAVEKVVLDQPTYDKLARWPDALGNLRPARASGWTIGAAEVLTVGPVVPMPTAVFTVTPASAAVDAVFTMTNNSTDGTSFLWQYGDGSQLAQASKLNTTHFYTAPGTYTITLTVTNATGSAQVTHTVTVTGTAPVGAASYEAELALIGIAAGAPVDTVAIPPIYATAPGYTGTGYVGTFGDPGQFVKFQVGNTPVVIAAAGMHRLSFRYTKGDQMTAALRELWIDNVLLAVLSFPVTAPAWDQPVWTTLNYDFNWTTSGNKSVELRVPFTAAQHSQYIDFDRLDVTPISVAAPPQANFSVNTTGPLVGATVNFTNLSTGGPTTWLWEYGDGATLTGTTQNPSHAYAAAGSYAAKLTVSNASGATSKTITITVSTVAPPDGDPEPLAYYKFIVGIGSALDYLLNTAITRTVTFDRKGGATATVSMRGEDKWVGLIKELETDLKITRNDDLYYRGRIGPSNHNGTALRQEVTFNSFDYRKKLGFRILKDEDILDFSQVDQGEIAWNLISQVQARVNGDDGIRQGVYNTGVLKDFSTEPGASVESSIDTLGNASDGFDWEIDPYLKLNAWAGGGSTGGRGSVKEVVIDFGGAFDQYTRSFGFETYANVIRATASGGLPPEWVEAADIDVRSEGRWERTASWPDVAAEETHQDNAQWLLDEVIAKKFSYEITLVPGFWLGKNHFWLGDTVNFILKHGTLNINQPKRIETLTIELDENGRETIKVVLS